MVVFLLIALTSLWTLGLFLSSEEGMLLYPLRQFIVNNFGPFADPIIGCVICMPSVHGGLIVTGYLMMQPEKPWWIVAILWAFVAMGGVVVNAVVFNLINFLRTYTYVLSELIESDSESGKTLEAK